MGEYEHLKPASSSAESLAELRPRAAAGLAYELDAPCGVFGGPASVVPSAGDGGGHALSDDVRAQMEASFGAGLSGIRIHHDASAEAVGADAYTRGTDIHFAPGKYDPGSLSGRQLLGHEIAHVLQQAEQRVDATAQHARAGALNDDALLEREADEAGVRAARGERARIAPATLSAASPVVQRRVSAVPTARKTSVELLGDGTPAHPGLRLDELWLYVLQQADWFAEPTLTAADRDAVWKVVHLLHFGPHVVTALANLHTGEVAALPSRKLLATYFDGFDPGVDTIRLMTPAATLARALRLGQAMQDLAFLPAPVRRHIIPESGLDYLIDFNRIPDLALYYSMFHPTLEQPSEWLPIQNLLVGGVAQWMSLLGWVSELHIFTLPTLNILRTHTADTSRARPVLLVLMSALDWNGALLYQSTLDTILADRHNLGLVIQGRTLGAITSQVARVARDYGKGGKLGQVVLAGHGSDTSMEMASDSATDGSWDATNNRVYYDGQHNIDCTDPKNNGTEALIDTILTSLDDKTANLVFVGCLINSHTVDPDASKLTGKAADVQAELRRRIAEHPNLADYAKARMKATHHPATLSASNASTEFDSFSLDGTGHARLVNGGEPDLAGPKPSYLATGREPEGVLRAAIESCADLGIAVTTTIIRLRMLAPSTGFSHACIRAGLGLALPATGNLDVAKLVDVGRRIGTWYMPTTAEALADSVHPGEARAVFGALLAGLTGDQDDLAARIHHAWMKYEPAHAAAMMTKLTTSKLTVEQLEGWLSRSLVDPHLATMLPVVGVPTTGEMLLALAIADLDASPPAHVRGFLRRAAGGRPVRAFPADLHVEALMPTGAERILERIGLSETASAPADAIAANVDVDGDGTNETRIAGVPRKRIVATAGVVVRERATSSSPGLGTLAKGAIVGVAGTLREDAWSLIDFAGRIGFIPTRDLAPEE